MKHFISFGSGVIALFFSISEGINYRSQLNLELTAMFFIAFGVWFSIRGVKNRQFLFIEKTELAFFATVSILIICMLAVVLPQTPV